jgi:Tetratricopeptide repeat
MFFFVMQEAEDMHLKAIKIKEMLLGQEDYEVALSLGHLASLYNYHMHHFRKAEELYLRSIAIGLILFHLTFTEIRNN